MKFRYTIMYVESVTETLKFYESAFGLKALFIHEEGDYAELSTGETKLAFSSISLMNSLNKPANKADRQKPTFEIAFETDNVKEAVDLAVNAGANLVQNAADMSWGQTVAYVHDNNGFLVEICNPVN